MKSLISKIAMSLTVLSGLVVLLAPTALAQGEIFNPVCNDPKAADSAVCKDSADNGNPIVGDDGILTSAINIVSIVLGIIAVFVILVGGFRYITSAGDSNTTASAQKQIIYAVVGLVVASTAQLLVRFVL